MSAPPSLLDTLLTGTFDELKEKLQQGDKVVATKRSHRHSDHSDSPETPLSKWRHLSQPPSTSVICKSKGRWTKKLKFLEQEMDNDVTRLNMKWKYNLLKCIDSSPLLISKGNVAIKIKIKLKLKHLEGQHTIVSCFHAGVVAALRP